MSKDAYSSAVVLEARDHRSRFKALIGFQLNRLRVYCLSLRPKKLQIVIFLGLVLAFTMFEADVRDIKVTATAYNSLPNQTQGDPNVGAWGDYLPEHQNVVAISRDLLHEGLGRGSEIYVNGYDEPFVVLDKMGPRWTKRIDLFMDKDLDAAIEFGRQPVEIYWQR